LSSVGNSTLEEMGMGGIAAIHAHNTTVNEKPDADGSGCADPVHAKNAKPSKAGRRKVPNKRNKSSRAKEHPVASEAETIKHCKVVHSEQLTRLHEEAEPTLKLIRKRLNDLDLKHHPPKRKDSKKKKKPELVADRDDIDSFARSDFEGKAGTPFYIINVGDVQNLYITTKRCSSATSKSSVTPFIIDLHGCTQSEALSTLNEMLPAWVDAAMRGEYPWVISVKIVVGCGSQIVSDAVRDWIRGTRGVCNAPKNHTFM